MAEERTRATAAGVYDWCLGGHHHLPCDAEAAIAAQRAFPLTTRTARYNRDFLQRVVHWLAKQGVRQYLDIGSGYPTAGNVHEIAQASRPDSRVVYVDIDPDTVAVSNGILADDPCSLCIQGDISDPDAVLGHPGTGLLDFTEPVGLLLVSVLPFVEGDVGPLLRRYIGALAPGSHVAISHITAPEGEHARLRLEAAERQYNTKVQQRVNVRSGDEITALFDGTELVPPGLVRATHWHPPRPGYVPGDDDEASGVLLGGVGRVP
ncbi:SAM-dependent methyltransferase [Prauserella endophytica]|uniref:SAM-dependent methyltransferase n=1 Tax=Prauserella endophytica TaxID=1592324 RepID=A0ABY2SBE3_9PSEU|nr:SAM-dependent methyltransferase [Prauserella endophytica]TKG72659.1 hypothetical protein FCN18_05310 [Prauserella endophytica]